MLYCPWKRMKSRRVKASEKKSFDNCHLSFVEEMKTWCRQGSHDLASSLIIIGDFREQKLAHFYPQCYRMSFTLEGSKHQRYALTFRKNQFQNKWNLLSLSFCYQLRASIIESKRERYTWTHSLSGGKTSNKKHWNGCFTSLHLLSCEFHTTTESLLQQSKSKNYSVIARLSWRSFV